MNLAVIDIDTGEIIHEQAEGIIITTQEERARRRKQAEKREMMQMVRSARLTEFGRFFFTSRDTEYWDLSPETFVRLIYLNTFIGYADKKSNCIPLMRTAKTPLMFDDLASELGLSKSTVRRFWGDVSPKYLSVDDNGVVYANRQFFMRGRLNIKGGYSYQKCFVDGIRNMYRRMERKKDKHLGYVLRLIPYMSVEYNIICENPEEADIKKIKPITLIEICDLIGFDFRHVSRLLDTFKNTRIPVGEHEESVIGIVSDGGDIADAKVYINPHVIYAGNHPEKVEILGAFCGQPR